MSNYLLEIGVEELPASFVRSGLASLQKAAETAFARARLEPESVRTLGTPRRLTLVVSGVPSRQPDRRETVTGPPWSAAFRDGEPTKAAIGFAKKNGVEVDALQKVATEKGDYVAADIAEDGRSATEVLPEILPSICQGISFPKQMRWGEGDHAFGRPIHWLVSLLDAEVLTFELADVTSGRESRGHRFLAPAIFELSTADSYIDTLRKAHVWVDAEARRQKMEDALNAAATALGGVVVEDPFLLEECGLLVEEPFVVPGSFDPEFLTLPDAVVVSVMRDHQRYFAVRTEEGRLLPAYLNVVNTANAPDVIAKGNDRVLRARLADAQFFVTEDRKHPLESRLSKLDTVVFQRKLGTVGDKVRRIAALSGAFADTESVDRDKATRAARLAKADLETLIVFEFPELQGAMGRFYATSEGEDSEVAAAIEEHYRPTGADDAPSEGILGAIVGTADRLDTLVGCFGIGQQPSGSADPFALRRAALGVLRTALDGAMDINIVRWTAEAYDLFEVELKDRTEVLSALDEFFRARLKAHYRSQGLQSDIVEATLAAWTHGSLRDLDARMKAVAEFRTMDAYESLAIAFKRAFNIAKDAERGDVDSSKLEAGAEATLAATFDRVRGEIESAISERRYTDALRRVAEDLRAPIDTYFDEVYVMVDDEDLRANRLRLLSAIADTVSQIAHFHLLAGLEAS